MTSAVLVALLVACGAEPPQVPTVSALPALPSPSAESPSTARGEVTPRKDLSIALVGEVRGEIDPCGCPTAALGGFERRDALLSELREEGPVIQLDAGELLLRGMATQRTENREARARLLLEMSRRVGVDAWAPGPTDLLALGLQGLLHPPVPAPPMVSATWQDVDGAPLLSPSRVIERSGLRVGVIGLSADPPPSVAGVRARDPIQAVRAAVADLPDDLDIIVALGSVDVDTADRVAAAVPELALVLTTQGAATEPPHAPAGGGALVIDSPDRGRYLQVVRLAIATRPGGPVQLAPDRQRWRDLRTLREQLRNAGDQADAALREQVADAEASLDTDAAGRVLVFVTPVPLGADLGSSGEIDSRIERFKEASRVEAARMAAQAPPKGQPFYASSGGCAGCHTEEFARWSFSKHARAWETLEARGEQGNPECVACHSTGYGEPGGLGALTPSAVRKYKAVQCEACHGPMGGHPEDPRVHGRPIKPAGCIGCHDQANSPDFDYAPYLRKATCQAPGGKELR